MSITIGEYTIVSVHGSPDCDYVVSHRDGEAMGVTAEQLQQMFADFFRDNM